LSHDTDLTLPLVSFSIILPSLQPYLSRNGASAYFYGLTVAIYSVGEMFGAMSFGKVYEALTVKYETGAKATLLMCIGLGVAGSALYVLGDIYRSPYMILWGRMLQGLWTGGKQVVEQTYLSETAPPERVTELTSELGTFAILGFVCGPSFGALFTSINVNLGHGLVLDAYTAPGWFILALCVIIFGVVCIAFKPEPAPSFDSSGIAGKSGKGGRRRNREEGLLERSYTMDSGGGGSDESIRGGSILAPPNERGLTVLLLLFVIHFFSFAIQETITTPFVLQAYGWTQRDVNLLFVGVGIVSLVTSVGVKYATRCVDDYKLLITSLVVGFVGSILLIDSLPGWGGTQVLPLGRFFLGFTMITVAFPFGRNVSLSVFSQILGPTPHGEWFGWMFAAGAVPRIIGPSWSLYALDVACKWENIDCLLGGRTWLEFTVNGAMFAVGVVVAVVYRRDLKPYGVQG